MMVGFDEHAGVRLHELRMQARTLYEVGRWYDSVVAYVVAADFADAVGIRVDGNLLRMQARRLLVLAWASERWSGLSLEDVTPARRRGDPLGVRPVSRFWIQGSWLDRTRRAEPRKAVYVRIDRNDNVHRIGRISDD